MQSLLLNQAKLEIQLQTLSRALSKATSVQKIKHCENNTHFITYALPLVIALARKICQFQKVLRHENKASAYLPSSIKQAIKALKAIGAVNPQPVGRSGYLLVCIAGRMSWLKWQSTFTSPFLRTICKHHPSFQEQHTVDITVFSFPFLEFCSTNSA